MNYLGHSSLQAVSPGCEIGEQVGSGEAAGDGKNSVYPMDEDDVWIEGGEALQGDGPQVVADQAEDQAVGDPDGVVPGPPQAPEGWRRPRRYAVRDRRQRLRIPR